ncbi:DUF1294 domain-containing protein [Asticcacaulis endophyticus]|uniref:DUF1294 domain-containing protein n=1 Tax=Asticcacaulis endophyticus TaxID=1395890 RepID=A0A918Q2N3_9CAUL|nr:DUF1294 domain-containing protein [Asticcacaulis endophyticus]GGZ28648.1 hypothetical protein GCM10011273_13090 [Asticcacaulis endophyticus]
MTIWFYLALYLGMVNFLTYVVWAMDKKYAVHGARRVSERRLLGLCLLGGWPSALIGTYRLRHKSSKPSFLVKMYALIALQIGSLGWLTWYAIAAV